MNIWNWLAMNNLCYVGDAFSHFYYKDIDESNILVSGLYKKRILANRTIANQTTEQIYIILSEAMLNLELQVFDSAFYNNNTREILDVNEWNTHLLPELKKLEKEIIHIIEQAEKEEWNTIKKEMQ